MFKHGEEKIWKDQEVTVVKEIDGFCEKRQPVRNPPAVTVADITMNHNAGMLEVLTD